MGKKGKRESATPCREPFGPLPVESKTPATAVLLLNSPEDDIVVKACQAIYAFAEKGDENKVCLLGLGALEPLCRVITHNEKVVKRSAFMALGTLAIHGEVKNVLKKLDPIPSIVKQLSLEEDLVIYEFATLCLASLSVDFVCKVRIVESQGVPPLIQFLSVPEPDVQKNSLEVIFNLVQDYNCRLKVLEMDVIPPLLELLTSEFPVIQDLVLKTLQKLTTEWSTLTTFREKQGFDKMMAILNNTDFSDLHSEALQVVANCLADSESVILIHEDGTLTKLVDFLLKQTLPDIQSKGIRCITQLAHNFESLKLLCDEKMGKILINLLNVADITMRIDACHALTAISLHQDTKDFFRELGGVPSVVQLLRTDNLTQKEAATEALSNLTYDNQLNAFAVYEAGGHEIVIQQLQESCLKVVASSATTLCNLAEHEVIRNSMLSFGAMEILVEPLKSPNEQIRIKATQCLSVLACDNRARLEFNKAGGFPVLVNLLRSFNKDMQHNACLAVNVCSGDELSTMEMCKAGALEILQEINQSKSRKSHFSKLAMLRLLHSNLSVKYSLIGHLTASDIITSGFYDPGKLRLNQKILNLEELSMQPVNQHRPIIAINTEETIEVPELETTTKVNRKTQRKKKKEEKRKDGSPSESFIEKPWSMSDDVPLQTLIKVAKESILLLNDEEEQFVALARLVSEAMGGAVEMGKLFEFPWMMHLSELRFQLQSNVLPIGLISRGIYCHRALLYKNYLLFTANLSDGGHMQLRLICKCLADCIGLSCSLVRGDYNRAWNEILLLKRNPSSQLCLQPERFIVDLMHQPGSLLAVNTPAALQYQTI